MNNRQRVMIDEELDDIANQFQYVNKERAFTRLVQIVRKLVANGEE
jgi:hypothetical protein